MSVLPAIEVQQLSVQCGDACLLNQVSCQFKAGKIHAILGQNGAGKSTLLNCLSHEIQPSKGQVIWHGKPLEALSYAELAIQRAVLSQSNELAFSFTVEALVSLGEEVQSRSQSASKQVIQTVLAVCEMTHLKDRDYLTLSGGEQKRAQLARVLAQIWPTKACAEAQEEEGGALFSTPLRGEKFLGKWLLLDEWTAGLDIKHQQSLARYFKQWAKQGLGIIMVLHDISFAAQLADHALILNAGKVFAEGDIPSVFTEEILSQSLEMKVRVEQGASTGRPAIYPII